VETKRAARTPWIYALLLVPFVGTLWVPLYNFEGPQLFGFPFFYWYQFAWVLVGAVINATAYFATR
jgi:hypothetical protein